MANVTMYRGGSPDFKPMFCRGDWAEYGPPISTPHYEDTPPYNSHADGVYEQGYLNLAFPLNPNLQRNDAHKWMREALKNVSAVGDIIRLNWIPLRTIGVFQHFEVTRGDELIDGVYVKPVAERCHWDIAKKEWVYEENADYAAAVTASGVGQFPLGSIKDGDQQYGVINLLPAAGKMPCTFGHNLVKYDDQGVPTEGLDQYYGGVVLGLQIAEGSEEAISNIWRSNCCLYTCIKILAFEAPTQVG